MQVAGLLDPNMGCWLLVCWSPAWMFYFQKECVKYRNIQAKTMLVPKPLLAYRQLAYSDSTPQDHAGEPASPAPFCLRTA